MTRLLPLYASLVALALAGCGEESTELPEDGREVTSDNYEPSDVYTGRVMNGYLRNARVWLDLDGDGLYTGGEVEVTLPSGSVATVSGGEPTALSGEGGQFTLDVSGLEQPEEVAPDLNPRDYRLHAVVLPGLTEEETRSGNEVLQRAYILSAPERVRSISPLTTLEAKRNDFGGGSELTERLAGLNLLADYNKGDNDRGKAYSSMLTRFMREQLPEEYTQFLREDDGTNLQVNAEALELLGIALVQNAEPLLELVDDAAGGDYGSVDVDSLELPPLELELNDPLLLVGQTVYQGEVGTVDPSAKLSFSYGSDARLAAIEADGCMQPTLFEIARLANADGKAASTINQWFPAVSLSDQSAVFLESEGADERLTFDWDNRTARFDTTTTCHGDVIPDSSELDWSEESPAEITYEWEVDGDGRVVSLTADFGGITRTFEPDYTDAGPTFFGYELTETVEGSDPEVVETLELLELTEGVRDCSGTPTEENADADFLVTGRQGFDYTDSEGATVADFLAFDLRNERERLLSFGFPTAALAWGIDQGFRWSMTYREPGGAEDQSGLISRASMGDYAGAPECWAKVLTNTETAQVVYRYDSLSAYLTGQID